MTTYVEMMRTMALLDELSYLSKENERLSEELAKLSEENKRLRDELTAADLMCEMLTRELNEIKLNMGVFT